MIAEAVAIGALAAVAGRLGYTRLRLSRAKAWSLQGHARIARFLAHLVPFYAFSDDEFFGTDGAPASIVSVRRAGFQRLAGALNCGAPHTLRASRELASGLSDAQFTNAYRVPFQYRRQVNKHLEVGSILTASTGVCVTDLDGREAYDLSGSYGVNVFGYDFYKTCIEAGIDRVHDLGPVLGAYHPLIQDNIDRLRALSGLDEVSFHMSGTEAVMQAVRLARFHTRRSHLVRFAGAYHGWWDDVQPGIGNPRVPRDTYTLKDMSARSLDVLRTRRDIACVLVNPLQALHPNAAAYSDGTLVCSDRRAGVDRGAYAAWLQELRRVCSRRGIALIFDEVFVGFRIALGGAQEYFGVAADMVTYGKTLAGGLPIGVLCGTHALMRRFRDDRPSEICFARGTFNSHPYVMGAMNEFLRRLDEPEIRASYAATDSVWSARARRLNARLECEDLPVRVANLGSIWTVLYTIPCRYNWMLQFYLRGEGLRLSWVGTGRLIFSHNFTDADFAAVADRFVSAVRRMKADGWWWEWPSLTNASIQRRIAREIAGAHLAALGIGARVNRGHAARSVTIGSKSSPRST